MRMISEPRWAQKLSRELLCEIDLDKLSEELKKELEDTQQGQKRVKLLKDLMLLRHSDSAVTVPNG